MTIDWTKPLKTRDGRPARYLGSLKGPYTRVVVVPDCDGGEHVDVYTEDGKFYNGNEDICDDDLVQDDFVYVNVYLSGIHQDNAFTYSALETALRKRSSGAVTVKVGSDGKVEFVSKAEE